MTLFYTKPNALNIESHKDLKIKPASGFGFARGTNSIPVAADEFFPASAHYPIVFAGSGEQMTPVVIVGMQNGRNVFTNDAGAWKPDSYVPAYVRRYPFALAKVTGRDDLVLAIDEAAEILSSDEGTALYEDGKPSALAQRAIQVCANFERQSITAQQFSTALAQTGLLIDKRAEVRQTPESEPYVFSGFHIVDEVRFNALPDETYLDWRRRGWIALIHAHLLSLQRWPAIAALAGATGAFEKATAAA